MDWQLAITRNREALITIVTALMASLGLVKGGTLTTLPFHVYRKALLILRPAEAALRRLIVIAAHDLMLRGFKVVSPNPLSGPSDHLLYLDMILVLALNLGVRERMASAPARRLWRPSPSRCFAILGSLGPLPSVTHDRTVG